MLGIPQWKQPHSVLKVSPGSYFLMHRVFLCGFFDYVSIALQTTNVDASMKKRRRKQKKRTLVKRYKLTSGLKNLL